MKHSNLHSFWCCLFWLHGGLPNSFLTVQITPWCFLLWTVNVANGRWNSEVRRVKLSLAAALFDKTLTWIQRFYIWGKILNTHRKQKIFLQEWVQKEDNLIKALKHKAERGRYIVRYDANNKKLHAVMTQSDPRRYKFPASNSSSLCLFQELELNIKVESKVCTFNLIA